MDIGSVIFLLVLAAMVLFLPLVGRKWSAIVSYVAYGMALAYGLLGAIVFNQDRNAGISGQLADLSVWIAVVSAAMIVLTFVVYRYRQRKRAAAL